MSYLCAGFSCVLSALCYAEYACDIPMAGEWDRHSPYKRYKRDENMNVGRALSVKTAM